jgi:hypothetical protein
MNVNRFLCSIMRRCHERTACIHIRASRTGWLYRQKKAIFPNPESGMHIREMMMGTEIQKTFAVRGMKIPYDADGRANITAVWIAAGRPKSRNPDFWLQNAKAREFVASVQAKSKSGNPDLLRTVRGNVANRGTWAHWQIALAYASWMSPEIHQEVNEGYRKWLEEEKNPGLKIERGIEKYRQMGMSSEWINERIEGIAVRKQLTSTMHDHNCKPNGKENPYAEVSRSVSLAATGQTPKEFKKSKGLCKSGSTRDAMNEQQINRTKFLESECSWAIKKRAADGNKECLEVCGGVIAIGKETFRSLG